MSNSVENIIFIVIDALRADRVGAYSDVPLTPNIDALAEDGEVFESCFACSNVTDSCLTTILTGQYPARHGIINHGTSITEEAYETVSGTRTLPELLKEYETIGVNRKKRWHKRGFDVYDNPEVSDPGQVIQLLSTATARLPDLLEVGIRQSYRWVQDRYAQATTDQQERYALWYPKADELTDDLLNHFDPTGGPQFLFTHYWDTHIPYRPLMESPTVVREREYEHGDTLLSEAIKPIAGSEWGELLTDLVGDSETVGDMIRKYETGVRFADKELGQLIDRLKDAGEYENTAVVVTADHGESLTEHGILFEHHGLYDQSTHVPLIVKAPGFEGREHQFVQHFDIVPTVLDIAGIDYHPEWFDGVSLIPADGSRDLDRGTVYMESAHKARKRAVRTRSYKYIERIGDRTDCRYCGIAHARDRELYDLDADPGETANVVDDRPDVAANLSAKIDDWIRSIPDPEPDRIDFEIPKHHLDDLGYL